jgi:hypothetical protein
MSLRYGFGFPCPCFLPSYKTTVPLHPNRVANEATKPVFYAFVSFLYSCCFPLCSFLQAHPTPRLWCPGAPRVHPSPTDDDDADLDDVPFADSTALRLARTTFLQGLYTQQGTRPRSDEAVNPQTLCSDASVSVSVSRLTSTLHTSRHEPTTLLTRQ